MGGCTRWSWWPDLALAVVLAAVTAALGLGYLVDLDLAVRDRAFAWRDPTALAAARAVNLLGQGGLLQAVAGALAVWLVFRQRSLRPLLPVLAAYGALLACVGALKVWSARPYPRESLAHHPADLFADVPHQLAYPSGHVANAVVWWGVIALLAAALRRAYGRRPLPRTAVRVWRVGAPLTVVATTVYLRHHWLTDAVAGLAVGLLLDRARSRVPWDTLPLPGGRGRWVQPAFSAADQSAATSAPRR
ncbi:MAG TPA: phosphatase PAP2 family protein [Pilimelia sp.]|nr:phosphatase PAP2 family protein [Pilimelia sp.]